MLLPTLNELPTARDLIDVFGGYNHNLRIGSGEFYDMKNLTSDNYPVMSPRKQRGVAVADKDPICMISKEKLCYLAYEKIDETSSGYIFNLGDDTVNVTAYLDATVTAQNLTRHLVSIGTTVIIFPDSAYVNTIKDANGSYQCGKINYVYRPPIADFEIGGQTITGKQKIGIEMCDEQGNILDPYPEFGDDNGHPPDPTPDGYLWWDTLSDDALSIRATDDYPPLLMWDAENNRWITIEDKFIRISAPGIGKDFSVGNTVQISGVAHPTWQLSEMKRINTSHRIIAKGDDFIVVRGSWQIKLNGYVNEDGKEITVSRTMPKMDYVIESGNRLWGCRFGEANNGEFVNEIYASSLGDYTSWNSFEGVSTDSYVASVGTEGKFTGAVTHLGYPIFFKENCMHKVYGNYPSNYQIQTTSCRGVQDGCHKSLAVVNEVLYFKARTGVCAYDGSLPVEISSALGNEVYSDATAGALGNKYYISMKDSLGSYHMFVYDTAKGLWHREDDTQATEFCNCRGELYYIDYAVQQIKTVLGTGTLDTSAVEWEAITGTIGTDMPDKKYISRLDVRMLLNVGASVFIYAEYDSSGAWELLHSMNGISLRSFAIPIKPKRCDHLRLKIVGRGDAKIFSICKTIEQGSDV